MKIFTVLAFLVLLIGCTHGTHRADTLSCPERGKFATFGVDDRSEDYLRGCFPCCFCCGPDGDCCDECNDNNNLAAPQLPSNDE